MPSHDMGPISLYGPGETKTVMVQGRTAVMYASRTFSHAKECPEPIQALLFKGSDIDEIDNEVMLPDFNRRSINVPSSPMLIRVIPSCANALCH